MSPDAVVVTAAAIRTPLGTTRREVLARMCDDQVGIRPALALEGAGPGDRSGECEGGSAGPDRAEALLGACLADAWREACGAAGAARPRPTRIRILVGTTLHGMRHGGAHLRGAPLREAARVAAAWVVAEAARRAGLPAAGITLSTACASGITAVACGMDLLRAGEADLVLAGGYDAVSEYSHAGFSSLRLQAAGSPRPFAKGRDGMRTSEGYALLALELERLAVARGAAILARVAGVGESSDAFHLTQPEPEGVGASAALLAATDEGRSIPSVVLAHATGTPANDGAEYRSLERAFGARLDGLPVTAPKSRLGHTLGAAGAVDAALCVAMMEEGRIPGTATPPEEVDAAEFPRLRLVARPEARRIDSTMNVAIGFGGSNAALRLARPEAPAAAWAPACGEVVVSGAAALLPQGVWTGAEVAAAPWPEAGPVPDEVTAPLVDARACRRVAPLSRLVRAVVRAIADRSALDARQLSDAQVICATQHGALGYTIDGYGEILRHGLGGGNPLLFAESVPNVPSAQCSLAFGVRGASLTVIGARTAFLEGLHLARVRLQCGRARRVLVVAADEHHALLGRILESWGWRGGSAAAAVALLLETPDAARERGAAPLARLDGTAWEPPPEPGRHGMWRALVGVSERLAAPRLCAVAGAAGIPGRLESRLLRRCGGGAGCSAEAGADQRIEAGAAGPALLVARLVAGAAVVAGAANAAGGADPSNGGPGAAGTVLALDGFGAAAGARISPWR